MEAVELKEGLKSFIEEWKNKPGNLIMVLHRVQEEYGYIPFNVAVEISKILDVPLAKIYGVVTFYHFFRLTKPGKHKISVCMGTACYLKGGNIILEELQNILSVNVNGTTDDGLFTLMAVRCIGCCGLSPVMTIDNETYGRLTKDKLPGIIAKYKK